MSPVAAAIDATLPIRVDARRRRAHAIWAA